MQEIKRRSEQNPLFLSKDSLAFANEYRAREVIEKYCSLCLLKSSFPKQMRSRSMKRSMRRMWLADEVVEHITEEVKRRRRRTEKESEDRETHPCFSLSDTLAIGARVPSAQRKNTLIFTAKCSWSYKEPLFWIHLNMDYPFNKRNFVFSESIRNMNLSEKGDDFTTTIKFLSRTISSDFEFLMVLKGVIGCPDLPLNVRSALQNDGFVNKVADYISKKVADKLTGMFKTDRENYEKYWDDISPFIKFGCLKMKNSARR